MSLIYADRVEISMQYKKVVLYYYPESQLPIGSQYYIFFNGVQVDDNGYSGKEYLMSCKDIADLSYFAVSIDPDTITDMNMFNRIIKDHVLDTDDYVCSLANGLYESDGKPNFVKPEWGMKGKTIRRGSIVSLMERRRLKGDIFIIKPAGQSMPVVKIKDYRYYTNFDIQAYRASRIRKCLCAPYRYPAYRTTGRVNGEQPIDELNVNKI